MNQKTDNKPALPQQNELARKLNEFQYSIQLPLFHADKKKDSLTAELWIEKLEAKAAKNNCDNHRECMELFLTLREPALAWWFTLSHDDNINRFSDWEKVKSRFLFDFHERRDNTTSDSDTDELEQLTTSKPELTSNKIRSIWGKLQKPPPRNKSLEKQHLLAQLKSEIQTQIQTYQRNAVLESITKPDQAEATLDFSDRGTLVCH